MFKRKLAAVGRIFPPADFAQNNDRIAYWLLGCGVNNFPNK